MKSVCSFIAVLVPVVALAACGSGEDSPSASVTSESSPEADVANPAAVFCEEQGGKTFGPEPMCGLPDGSTIDAWEYYRAETASESPLTSTPTVATEPINSSVETSTTSTSTVVPAATSTSTTVVEELVLDGEPFRRSYPTVAQLPALSTTVIGHIPYDGPDRTGVEGLVRESSVRVFEGASGFTALPEFSMQMNDCGDAFWVARWVSESPDVLVLATNEAGMLPPEELAVEPWLLPEPAPAGLMGGSICTQPAFRFSEYVGGGGGNLVDVVVEWTYFDRDFFEPAEEQPAAADPQPNEGATCPTYEYSEYEPFSLCTNGPGVETLQRALIFFGYLDGTADGYFGPGTDRAVRELQRDYEVPDDGIVGGWWYREFIETYNLSR